MSYGTIRYACVIAGMFSVSGTAGLAANVSQAVAATVLKAELASQTVFVRTADGKNQTFRFTSQTPVNSLVDAARTRGLDGGAGYQFIIHYQVNQGEKVATAFDYVGREEWKKLSGMIVTVDAKTRRIVVKSVESPEENFLAGPHCAVQTTSGAKSFNAWAGEKAGEEYSGTIYYTVFKNRKVVHLLEFSEPLKKS